MHLPYVKGDGKREKELKIAWMMLYPEKAEVGAMAVKVAKNRAGVAATAPLRSCQRTPDPARSHKATPV